MTDLEGAFDATCRKGLMYKTYDCGITGNLLIIINSYLENRKARNLVNNFTSDWFYTTKGLLRGSIISPILFLIFTGDLSADPRASNSIIDTLISHSSTGKNLNTSKNSYKTSRFGVKYAKKLRCFTKMLPQMGDKHKYKENKSYSFQWGKNTPNISLKIKNNTIKQVTAKRMLGVIIDEKLTFKDHIRHICMQARKSYPQLAAFSNLPLSTLKTLYKSFIRSKLEYCCSVWRPKLYLLTSFKILNLFKQQHYHSFYNLLSPHPLLHLSLN